MNLKEIPGTLGFLADSNGDIYDSNKQKRNKYLNGDGYSTSAVLTTDGRWVTYGVARLVALAHLKEKPTITKCQVNHRDHNKLNDSVSNLEWVTASQNNIHSEIMRTSNSYVTLICLRDNEPFALFTNTHCAAQELGLSVLDIWDSIKDSKNIGNFTFKHKPFNGVIPKILRTKINYDRDSSGAIKSRAVKTLDIDTGEVLLFDSLASAGRHFCTSASHLYQSIPKTNSVSLFRKKFQVSYIDEEFPEISLEDLDKARNHGPRDVIAFNVSDNKFVIYTNAKEFIASNNLSKKAVTTSLAKGEIRKIGDWVPVYFTKENYKRLKNYVRSPVFT
jgi:hypothetical protein